ncbi:MAG TPA: class I SAM-dependent methyltransferase [Chitinophaga sp.]
MVNRQVLMSESTMWTAISKTVDFFYPPGTTERSKLRVADLGCLEGGYTVQFARMGFQSVGIEAREENIQKCNYVKANLNLPNLEFIQDDARNLSAYGKFDIVFCSGLLYHLHDPVRFLQQLSDNTSGLLILNTHVAPVSDLRYALGFFNRYLIYPLENQVKFLKRRHNYRLSGITENEGYRGRWYREWNKQARREAVEKILWASYNNHRSFWLCKRDLTKALHKAGFKSVFEQFDFTGDIMPDNFIDENDRSMFVAVKY